MRDTTYYVNLHPNPYGLPPLLRLYRLSFVPRALRILRSTHADKYNGDYMENDIKTIESRCLDIRQRQHEENLLEIANIRSQQNAKLDELQAMQCLVYDALKKVRSQLAALEAETETKGGV